MKMKRTFLKITGLFIALFATTALFAQQITVKSFDIMTNDLEARTNPVEDQNGDKCAIIKIETTITGFNFDGDMLGIKKIKEDIGEIWIYVPPKSKSLTIKHAKYGILRSYAYPLKIEPETVYIMKLS